MDLGKGSGDRVDDEAPHDQSITVIPGLTGDLSLLVLQFLAEIGVISTSNS